MVAHGGTTAALAPAGGDDYDFLWAAWGDDAGLPRTVHLALMQCEGSRAHVAATTQREGYAPSIEPMDGWIFGARGVMLLRYQTGAAGVPAEIWSIGPQSLAARLADLNRSAIEGATVDGATVIKVFAGAELRTSPRCYGWATDVNRLTQVECGPASR